MQFDVSVIIVNWNSGDFLKKTVESLYETTQDINFELIVVDNNSDKTDQSYIFIDSKLNEYKNVRIILNDNNLGFARANNMAMDISSGNYILLLNPDVIIQNNMVKILHEHMKENAEVGMAGPKVLNPDNTFQAPCMRGEPYPLSVLLYLSGIGELFKNNPDFNKFSLIHLDNNCMQYVAGLSGCCMMISKKTIEEVGKMDEQFFLYQEETDWCWRVYKSGFKIVYNPEALIIHDKGATTRKKILKTNFVFCNSMMKFFKKHHFKNYNIFQQIFFLILIWGNFFVRYIKSHIYYKLKKQQ